VAAGEAMAMVVFPRLLVVLEAEARDGIVQRNRVRLVSLGKEMLAVLVTRTAHLLTLKRLVEVGALELSA
jgi:hypothetical protein